MTDQRDSGCPGIIKYNNKAMVITKKPSSNIKSRRFLVLNLKLKASIINRKSGARAPFSLLNTASTVSAETADKVSGMPVYLFNEVFNEVFNEGFNKGFNDLSLPLI